MNKTILFLAFLLTSQLGLGQAVGINTDGSTPESGTMLEVKKNLLSKIRIASTNLIDTSVLELSNRTPGNKGTDFLLKNIKESGLFFLSESDLSANTTPDILVLKPNGNIGVGLSSPTQLLDVAGGIRIGNTASSEAGSMRWSGTKFEGYDGSSWKDLGGAGIVDSDGDTEIIATNGVGLDSLSFYAFGRRAMRIFGSPLFSMMYLDGKMGIGTSMPSTELQVNGSDTLSSLLITSNSTNGDSELIFGENKNNSFGMKWKYDGVTNKLNLFGKSGATEYGPHLSIHRSDGKVGIGTDSPIGNLDIKSSDELNLVLHRETDANDMALQFFQSDTMMWEWETFRTGNALQLNGANDFGVMYIKQSGDVGIGTISPSARLDVRDSGPTGPAFKVYKNNLMKLQVWENGGLGIGTSLTAPIPANGLFVSGDVNIGTQHKDGFKVSVNGKMVAEELLVELSDDWPDYVFEKSYDLLSMDELEKSISENGHLPGIPSAKDIEENGGIMLGEMQRLMMEKIEELTLHLIRQQKEIDALRTQLKSQTK